MVKMYRVEEKKYKKWEDFLVKFSMMHNGVLYLHNAYPHLVSTGTKTLKYVHVTFTC